MLFFSSRKIFFSLINSFFFSIWTAKTSLRSVLTTIQISKKKELIAEKKKFLSEKKLRMRALPFQCNAFPATKKIYFMFTMTIWLCEDLFNEFLKFPLFFDLWLNYTNCHLSIKIKTNRKNIASKFSNDYFLGGSFKILPSKPFTKPDSHCKLRKP